MDANWERRISEVCFHIQPIVNIYTGDCFGVEYLLRGVEKLGFNSIQEFFDQACREQVLYSLDMRLREKAIASFCSVPFHRSITMFYNIDNRIITMPDFEIGRTSAILQRHGLSNRHLCYELSERHDINNFVEAKSILTINKQQSYKIAIDDFGSGFSGLQQLYHLDPDFIKLDRFFINDLERDKIKRLLVSNIVDLSHVLGIEVIAEGVETESEFYACKQAGCDFVQGYLIQPPLSDADRLRRNYELVVSLNREDRRQHRTDRALIAGQIQYIEPVQLPEHDIKFLFERFRKDRYATFFPVTTPNYEPLGIVREKDLKEFVYSPYGRDLLMNRSAGRALIDFVSKCPIADINNRLERVIELFALSDFPEGIMVTENGRYLGFLSAGAMLNAIHEKNIELARDQNPLTRLPGNRLINDLIAKRLDDREQPSAFIYFDIDNFKPFNDRYGFRIGDRAIMLFSDLLRSATAEHGLFCGHIGGDDFFAAGDCGPEKAETIIGFAGKLIENFSESARMLFSEEERSRGYYESHTREGKPKRFALLTASAALVLVHSQAPLPADELARLSAALKAKAKSSKGRLAWLVI
jgi:EAL domain-containing protein (putative c-di-GMP-specific phosphodiesterase class I)/GGDEF domain-containing protein